MRKHPSGFLTAFPAAVSGTEPVRPRRLTRSRRVAALIRDEAPRIQLVMAGLVPAIPLRRAPCTAGMNPAMTAANTGEQSFAVREPLRYRSF